MWAEESASKGAERCGTCALWQRGYILSHINPLQHLLGYARPSRANRWRWKNLKPSPCRSGLTRARVQWHIELDGYAFWPVGGHCNTSVELSDQALDHLEAQARPRLVDIEIRRKTNPLI
jgi:hypothetical protein